MEEDKIVGFRHPEEIEDPLTEIPRRGARKLLAQAIEAEVAAFPDAHADKELADGRKRLVRHGHGPEREILTGIGTVPVRRAKVRDRAASAPGVERIRFTSSILPVFARRAPPEAASPTFGHSSQRKKEAVRNGYCRTLI